MPTLRQWKTKVALRGVTEKVFIGIWRGDTSPVTGAATPTIQMLRNGVATWSTITPSWTEAGNGVYLVGLTQAMKRTFGPLLVRIQSAASPTINDAVLFEVGVNDEDISGNVARIRHLSRRIT